MVVSLCWMLSGMIIGGFAGIMLMAALNMARSESDLADQAFQGGLLLPQAAAMGPAGSAASGVAAVVHSAEPHAPVPG